MQVGQELEMSVDIMWRRTSLPSNDRSFGGGELRCAERSPSSRRQAGVPVTSVHATRRTCASLLVALDVHPRVAMAILRHSKIAVTMDIYSQVSSASTRAALKRLGSQLGEDSA